MDSRRERRERDRATRRATNALDLTWTLQPVSDRERRDWQRFIDPRMRLWERARRNVLLGRRGGHRDSEDMVGSDHYGTSDSGNTTEHEIASGDEGSLGGAVRETEGNETIGK
eukprot:11603578-Alexandrium_andersonii.AAC.1